MSPLEYVQTLRLEEAKQLLESSDTSVESIANEVGYEDACFFSHLSQRQVRPTPGQYRKRFGSMRRALASGNDAHCPRGVNGRSVGMPTSSARVNTLRAMT